MSDQRGEPVLAIEALMRDHPDLSDGIRQRLEKFRERLIEAESVSAEGLRAAQSALDQSDRIQTSLEQEQAFEETCLDVLRRQAELIGEIARALKDRP